MAITLLVLAAGMGSRFGGPKQVTPVGPSGEILLDYSLYDARRAGFDRFVFVIRREMESAFRERLARSPLHGARWDFAFQDPHDLPPVRGPFPERTRPWGTGHAVRSARHCLETPFAVINADDYYGRAGFLALADYLRRLPPESTRFALVSYHLAATLSPHGAVSRGLCALLEGGKLGGITETSGLRLDGGRVVKEDEPKAPLDPDQPVSMNLWGFTPAVFPLLESGFERFLLSCPDPASAEFGIPGAVGKMIREGSAEVSVLSSADRWFGLTHPADLPEVRRAIATAVRAGDYPSPLSAPE
ncbi:MAG: nucleotidyltransferase [Puniceicoccaceae bacterium]|nr:MAG: nucleotidyltransferase [Puniceicoccaceae bacterium]